MEHILNYHEDRPNQHEKLCDETEHPQLSLTESQWKWDNNMIKISQWKWTHCRTNTSVRRKKYIQKSKE